MDEQPRLRDLPEKDGRRWESQNHAFDHCPTCRHGRAGALIVAWNGAAWATVWTCGDCGTPQLQTFDDAQIAAMSTTGGPWTPAGGAGTSR